jgi:hypothetical protein
MCSQMQVKGRELEKFITQSGTLLYHWTKTILMSTSKLSPPMPSPPHPCHRRLLTMPPPQHLFSWQFRVVIRYRDSGLRWASGPPSPPPYSSAVLRFPLRDCIGTCGVLDAAALGSSYAGGGDMIGVLVAELNVAVANYQEGAFLWQSTSSETRTVTYFTLWEGLQCSPTMRETLIFATFFILFCCVLHSYCLISPV